MWLPNMPLSESDLAQPVSVQSFSNTPENTPVASEPETSRKAEDPGHDTACESIQDHVDDTTTQELPSLNSAVDENTRVASDPETPPKTQDPAFDTACESIRGHADDTTTQELSPLNPVADEIQKSVVIAELRKRNEELQSRAEDFDDLLKGIKELQNRNEEAESLRKSNEELEILAMELRAKVTQNEMIYEKAKDDLRMHETKNESLQERLDELETNYISRLPFEQPVSENEILNRFDTLCQCVANWVATQIPWEDVTESMVLDDCDPQLASFLKDDDQARESMMVSLVHQCLQREFFGDHIYLVGLPDDYSDFIRAVENFMGKKRYYSEWTREPKTISEWRSETLKALAFHPDITEMRNSHGRSAAERIFSFVKQFCPVITNRQQSFTELYEQVITPSVALAFDMQTSWSQYAFIPAMKYSKDLYQFEQATVDVITSATTIDVKTRIPLDMDEPIIYDSNGFIAIPVMLVKPALYVCRHDRDNKDLLLPLRRGTYLVALFSKLELPEKDNEEQPHSEVKCRLDEKTFIAKLTQSVQQNHPQDIHRPSKNF